MSKPPGAYLKTLDVLFLLAIIPFKYSISLPAESAWAEWMLPLHNGTQTFVS